MILVLMIVGLCMAGMLLLIVSWYRAVANGDEWQRERLDNEQARAL
jgi:hypothetical protein